MNIRHGDMALVGIAELPADAKTKSKSDILMTGSGGYNHTYTGGAFYPFNKDQFMFGYLVAHKGCRLLHPEHGRKVKGQDLMVVDVPAGVYELRKQQEYTHEGMKPVVD